MEELGTPACGNEWVPFHDQIITEANEDLTFDHLEITISVLPYFQSAKSHATFLSRMTDDNG